MPKKQLPHLGLATGIPLTRPNRNEPTPHAAAPPSQIGAAGDRKTDVFTYFTKAGPQPNVPGGVPILYNADRQWADVTLVLETAGPVVVGTNSNLFPVLSGKGEQLITDVPMTFTIAKGPTRLYIASTGVNRVKVQIAPYAWLEELLGGINQIAGLLRTIGSK